MFDNLELALEEIENLEDARIFAHDVGNILQRLDFSLSMLQAYDAFHGDLETEIIPVEEAYNGMVQSLHGWQSELRDREAELKRDMDSRIRRLKLWRYKQKEIEVPQELMCSPETILRRHLENARETEDTKENLRNARELCEEITGTVDDFSRYIQGDVSDEPETDLYLVADKVLKFRTPKIEEYPLTSSIGFEEGDFTARINPYSLKRIITNFLQNSERSIRKKIVGGSTPEAYNPHVSLTAVYQNEGLNFTFWDNGIGIPQHKLSEIFDKGVTGGGGQGLGLYGVKKQVERYDGKVWAESELGKWAKLHVVLPVEQT